MAELKTSYATPHFSHTYRHHQQVIQRSRRRYLCPLASFRKALNKTHPHPAPLLAHFCFIFFFFHFHLTGDYCIDRFNHLLGNLDHLSSSKHHVGPKFGPVIPSKGPIFATGGHRVYSKRTGWFGTLSLSPPGGPCHKRR